MQFDACLYIHYTFSNAGAVVGLERTIYQVSEDDGVVEVCAVVYSPVIECPIQFSFNLELTTIDGSAGKKSVKMKSM